MAQRGRPTLYRSELSALARDHCRSGASNDQLAALFGVAPRSIDNWIRRIPEFAAAVNEGRAVIAAARAHRLFERAIGYTSTVERVVRCRGGTRTVTCIKHHLPETRACSRYLYIRRPQNWRRRPDLPPDAPQSSMVRAAHQFGTWQPSRMDDAAVAEALYQRAVGCKQTVARVMMCRGEPTVFTYTRHHRPQFQATVVWLSNKRPQDRRPLEAFRTAARSASPAAHKLVAAEHRHQREEAAITNVAVLATENGTEGRAKSPANQAVDPRNTRHDSTSKWVRKMSRIASPVSTAAASRRVAKIAQMSESPRDRTTRWAQALSSRHRLCKINTITKQPLAVDGKNVLNSYSLRHKPAGFRRSMKSEGATGIVWATAPL